MRIKIKHENKLIAFNAKQDVLVKDLLKALKNNEQLNLKNEEIILLDEKQKILESDQTIEIIPYIQTEPENNLTIELTKNHDSHVERELSMHTFKKICNPKYKSQQEFFDIKSLNVSESRGKSNQITELIQKTTDAKEKINVQESKVTNKTTDRLRIFEDLLSSNLGGLMGQRGSGPLVSQANQINELLNILRPMIENDVPESSYVSGSNRTHVTGNTSSNIFRPMRISSQPVVADENLINNLKEMGFAEEQCRRALIHARNDISRATDLLLSDGLDYIPSEPNNNNNNNNNPNQNNQDHESDGGYNDDQGMDEIGHDEEMSDIPNNIFSVNINDLNNNDIIMNDEFSENVLSENVNININFINPNQNPQSNVNNNNNTNSNPNNNNNNGSN